MIDDPFAPEADPDVVAEDAGPPRVGRRLALAAIGASAAVATMGGCAQPRVACLPPTATTLAPACVHRFCRYYRGA